VSNQTVRRWIEQGKFEKVETTLGGEYRIGLPVKSTTILYTRVSSKKQSSSLESQTNQLKSKIEDYDEVLYDIGSGFNFKRKQFRSLLERCLKGEPIKVVVSNQDRFSRVGFEFLQWIFERAGGSIEVLDKTETKQEFDYDNLISFITVFCNSYYGKRNASRNKKDKNLPK
jgi:predicted site-specific integrase-resolvase